MGKRRVHYTRRIAGEICEHIALGSSIAQALDKVGRDRAPSMQAFYNWLEAHDEFRQQYERARIIQADMQADKIMELASEVLANPSRSQSIKVAADILRWQAEVRNPRKYGQKMQHEITAVPLDPKRLQEEIARLEKEVGVIAVLEAIPSPTLPAPETESPEEGNDADIANP